MAVLVADAHVSSSACELNLQVVEDLFRLLAEDTSDGFDAVEVLEVVFEGVFDYRGTSDDLHFEFRNRFQVASKASYCERVVSEKCCPDADEQSIRKGFEPEIRLRGLGRGG